MTVILSKTGEMVISKGSPKQLPPLIEGIERKEWLILLGVTFQDNPYCWDLHVDGYIMSKASGRMHIFYEYADYTVTFVIN